MKIVRKKHTYSLKFSSQTDLSLNDGDDTELPELPPPDMKIESDDWIAEPLDSKISSV